MDYLPTADQWFTESPFESCRQVVYLVGNDALEKGVGMFAGINAQGVGVSTSSATVGKEI